MNPQKFRSLFESSFVIIMTLVFSLFISMLGAVATKFQLAFAVGFFGLIVIAITPNRRILCVCLWVITMPLSIEKILYTAPPLLPSLRGQEIILNAADVVLMLLLVILIFEKIIKKQAVFVWDKLAKLFFLLLVWGVFSYLMHVGFYHSEFVHSAPLGILHLTRNLLFVVIIVSAIETRADLIWVLISVAVMVFIESILVGISYAIGEALNFSRLLGMAGEMQKYTVDGEVVTRATGTLGVANQQGMFHAMFTFLLFGLFAVKNAMFRHFALITILGSFIAVIFTFSRSSWMTIGVANILIFAVFVKRKEIKPQAWLMGSLITILFIAVLAVVAKPIIDRLTKGDDGATDSRVRMIMLAKDLAIKYPIIGVSPSGYIEAGLYFYPPGQKETEWVALGDKAIVPPLGRIELATMSEPGQKTIIVPLSVHNKYLLMLSEFGVVGLLIWVMIFIRFFNEARLCSASKDQLLRFIGVAGMGCSLVAIIYMNLDLFADDKTIQVMLFPLLFVSAAYKIAKQQSLYFSDTLTSNKEQHMPMSK